MDRGAEGERRGRAGSLRRRAIRGSLLGVVDVGGVQALRLAGNLITTRLLFPEAYGLMGLVLVLSQGLHMVSDVGIVPSIVQHERGEERGFLDTAWTLQVLRGASITAVTAALAWPWARFYGEPQLLSLVLVASVQGIVSGLDSTKLATLHRRLEPGRLVFVDLAGQTVTLAVMVGGAYATRSVWALMAGAIAGDVTRTILSHAALPGEPNRFAWDRDAARVIFDFGKWIFLSSLVTYAGMRFDAMVLPKLVPLEAFGVYMVGQNLARLPQLVTGRLATWVLLPALSESFRRGGATFAANARRSRGVQNAAGTLAVGATALGAPAAFHLLWDPRYHDAGWMVQLLMVSVWFELLQGTAVRVQLAAGDSRAQTVSNLWKLAGTVAGALVGYALAALPGLILGLTAGGLLGWASVARGLKGRGVPIVGTDLAWTGAVLALGLIGGGTPWLLGPLLGVDAPLVSLVVGPAVLVPYAAWVGRRVLRQVRRRRR